MRATRIAILFMLCSVGTLALAAPPTLSPQTITLLQSGIPSRGAVEVRFASEQGAGEFEAGFDAATGAWYWQSSSRVLGVDTKGKVFHGDRSAASYDEHSEKVDIQNMAYVFPFLATRYYFDHQSELVGAETLPGDGLRLEIRLKNGGRSADVRPAGADPATPLREWLEIGPDARPTALWDDKLNPRRELAYTPDVHPPFWVPDHALDQRLVSYTYRENADPAAFTPQRVHQRLLESLARTEKALRSHQSSFAATTAAAPAASIPANPKASPQTSPHPSPAAPPAPSDSPAAPRFSWPVLAVGVALLALAAIAWFKSRR